MHIWIDIDKEEHTPFYIALINELEAKEHKITITAEDSTEIKNATNGFHLPINYISNGSLFGLFKSQLSAIRSDSLSNFIKTHLPVTAISLGSKPILYSCIELNINLILIIENFEEKFDQLFFKAYNMSYLIPEGMSEVFLLDKGYKSENIAKYKGPIQKNTKEQNSKLIKELVSKIEAVSSYKDIKA